MHLQFEKHSFGFLPNLKEIYLGKNLIRKLDFHFAFEFSTYQLRALDFSHNKIIFIDGFNFFSKFPHLSFLDLSFNDLHSLENTYFIVLTCLNSLCLSNNQILTIQNKTFDSLMSLIYLDLSHNLIYDLNEFFFTQLINLKELVLKFNKIDEVNRDTFYGLKSVVYIDLSYNKIKFLQENSFFYLGNIRILNLGSNKLNSLNNSLDKLKYITNLGISFNNLTMFNIDLLKNLTFLDLSHNSHFNSFNISNSLKTLNLSNTSSKLISKLKISNKSNLEEIDLSQNNLNGLN